MNFLERKYLEICQNIVYFLKKKKKECSGRRGRQKNMTVCQRMYKNGRGGHPNSKDGMSLRPIPQIRMPLRRQKKRVDMEHFMDETQLEQFRRRFAEEEKSRRTMEKYSRDLRAFRRYLGEKGLRCLKFSSRYEFLCCQVLRKPFINNPSMRL